MHASGHIRSCQGVLCRLATQAAAAAGSTPKGEFAKALEGAPSEWTTLQASRISCWQRRSGSDAPATDMAAGGGDAPGCGATQEASMGAAPEGPLRRGLLKRSPLPSVGPAPPPVAPLLDTSSAFAVGTPPGSFDREDQGLLASGSHSLLEPPALPLFQQSAPASTAPADAPAVEELPRQRSVRFSDQAAVKLYANSEEPSRVAGVPEGLETVATRSPQKRRCKRRRTGASGGSDVPEVSGAVEEVEEGEVAEGPMQLLPALEEPAVGASMYAL